MKEPNRSHEEYSATPDTAQNESIPASVNREKEDESEQNVTYRREYSAEDKADQFAKEFWEWVKGQDIRLHEWLTAFFSFVLAIVAILQVILVWQNSQISTIQIGKIIDAATKIQSAADKFSTSASGINTQAENTVKELGNARKDAGTAASNQLAALQTQVQMSERPLMMVGKPRVWSVGGNSTDPIKIGLPIGASFYYWNAGKSPALQVQIYRHLVFGKESSKNINPDPPDRSNFWEDVAPLGADKPSDYIGAITLKKLTNNDSDQFHPDPANELPWDGSFPIFVYGEIIYKDRFKNAYCTPFIHILINNKAPMMSPSMFQAEGDTKEHHIADLCPKDSIR